jgi:hypothetical protein
MFHKSSSAWSFSKNPRGNGFLNTSYSPGPGAYGGIKYKKIQPSKFG